MKPSKNYTKKGEKVIHAIKKSNKDKPKSEQVNPWAVATKMGYRKH